MDITIAIAPPHDSCNGVTVVTIVRAIADLPNIVLTEAGIIPDPSMGREEWKAFQFLTRHYRTWAEWLAFYWLGVKELDRELHETEKAEWRIFADRSQATLSYAQAVFTRSRLTGRGQLPPTPLHWFLAIAYESCLNEMEDCGLISGIAQLPGKHALYKGGRDWYGYLEDAENIEFDAKPTKTPWTEALEYRGAELAKEDIGFRNGAHRAYCRAMRRFARDLQMSRLQAFGFDKEGNFKAIGQGKRGEGKKRSRRERRKRK